MAEGPAAPKQSIRREREQIRSRRAEPLDRSTIQGEFGLSNCLNSSYNQNFSTLRIGENIEDFVAAPVHVCENEWIAYHLHHLIDRACVLFDLMKFFCNDGVFKVDFAQPMAYALPVKAHDISQEDRRTINQSRQTCINGIKIAEDKYIKADHIILYLDEATESDWEYPKLSNDKERGHNPKQNSRGASSYIDCILKNLKHIRANSRIFPRKREANFPPQFLNYAKFIIYHLINILSHYLTCHFDEINKLNIRMHVVTLAYNIFCLAERFDLLPPENYYSNDFLLINRMARKFECDHYQLLSEGAVGGP